MRTIISTPGAPGAVGTYSQAVKCGSTVYVSGQIPLDPATGDMVQGPMEAQIRRVFDNLKAIVAASGADFSKVAKVNVYLTDLGNFALLNKSWPSTSRNPTRRAPRSRSAHCPKARQWKSIALSS